MYKYRYNNACESIDIYIKKCDNNVDFDCIKCNQQVKKRGKSNMAELNLSKYGITGTTEIVHNPSYELLFEEET